MPPSRQKTVKQLVFKFGTEDYREVLGEIQRVGQNFSGTLQGAQDRLNALKQARAVLVRDDADNLVAIKRIDKEIAASGQQAVNALANSYKSLGFESEASLRAQVATAKSAYDAIEKSGVASLRDIGLAQEALKAQTAALNQKIAGTAEQLGLGTKAANFFKNSLNFSVGGLLQQGIQSAFTQLQQFAAETVRLGSAFQGIQTRLSFATGGQQSGLSALNDVRAVARTYGQDLEALANGYSNLRIRLSDTNISAEKQLELFKNLTTSVTALQIPTVQYEQALEQLIQGLSKGVVRSEDFRSVIQAGLVSLSSVAQALGTTVDQAKAKIDSGALTTEKALEAVRIQAERLKPAAKEAGDQYAGAFNRFKTAVTEVQLELSGPLLRSLTDVLNKTTGFFEKLKEIGTNPAAKTGFGFIQGAGTVLTSFGGLNPFTNGAGQAADPNNPDPVNPFQKLFDPFGSNVERVVPGTQLKLPTSIDIRKNPIGLPPAPGVREAKIIPFADRFKDEKAKLQAELATTVSRDRYIAIQRRLAEISDEENPLKQLEEAAKKTETAANKAKKAKDKADQAVREAIGALGFGVAKEGFGLEEDQRASISALGQSLGASPEFKKLIEDEKKIKDQLEGLGATFSEPFGGKAGGIFNVTSDRSFAPTPLLNSGVDRASPGGLGSPTDVGSANNLFQSIVDDSKKAQDALEETQKKGLQLSNSLGSVFENGFANAFTGFITGAQTAGQAFQNFAGSVVSGLAQIAAQQFAKSIFSGIAGPGSFLGGLFGVPNPEVPSVGSFSGFADFGSIFGPGKRAGGLIDAPGNSTSDSILTPTSSGEFVFPANRVREIGIAELERARAGFATRGSNSNQQGDVNFYVTTPDANSFRASKSQLEFDQLQQLRANARRNS